MAKYGQASILRLSLCRNQDNDQGKTDETGNHQRQAVSKWRSVESSIASIAPIEKPDDTEHEADTLDR